MRANIGTMLPIKRRVRGIFSVRRNTVLILIFIETQSPGHNRGSSLAACALETRILIKMWSAVRGTLCLSVKNHCHANSKISKPVRTPTKGWGGGETKCATGWPKAKERQARESIYTLSHVRAFDEKISCRPDTDSLLCYYTN